MKCASIKTYSIKNNGMADVLTLAIYLTKRSTFMRCFFTINLWVGLFFSPTETVWGADLTARWQGIELSSNEMRLTAVDEKLFILELPHMTVGLIYDPDRGDYLLKPVLGSDVVGSRRWKRGILLNVLKVRTDPRAIRNIEEKIANPNIEGGLIHIFDPKEDFLKNPRRIQTQNISSTPNRILRNVLMIEYGWQSSPLEALFYFFVPFVAANTVAFSTFGMSHVQIGGVGLIFIGSMLTQFYIIFHRTSEFRFQVSQPLERFIASLSVIGPIGLGVCVSTLHSLGVPVP